MRHGHFEYLVMPLRLTIGIFQALVNDVLQDFLNRSVFGYLDDILVFSLNKEEHVLHVRQVLQRLLWKETLCESKDTNSMWLLFLFFLFLKGTSLTVGKWEQTLIRSRWWQTGPNPHKFIPWLSPSDERSDRASQPGPGSGAPLYSLQEPFLLEHSPIVDWVHTQLPVKRCHKYVTIKMSLRHYAPLRWPQQTHCSPAPNYKPGQTVWLSSKDLPLKTIFKKLKPRYVGPYEIESYIEPADSGVNAPPQMKAHLTFHVSFS